MSDLLWIVAVAVWWYVGRAQGRNSMRVEFERRAAREDKNG